MNFVVQLICLTGAKFESATLKSKINSFILPNVCKQFIWKSSGYRIFIQNHLRWTEIA